jgi:uncharacterized protein YbaR (Trm112 family)
MPALPDDVLALLCCPDTHQPLMPATPAPLAAINLRVAGGESGSPPLAAALVREDGKAAYPILDGIPLLLIEEAIAL